MRIVFYLIVISVLYTTPDAQAQTPQITEWLVPYEGARPRDPYVDSQGRVWFCAQRTGFVGWFNSSNDEFKRYELADGVKPHNLIIDDNDQVWFAANTKPFIGRLDPQNGRVTAFPMPDGKAKDPHTLIFGAGDDLWFTAQWANDIGRLNRKTGEVDVVSVPVKSSRPYGIKLAPDGNVWVVLFGTNKLAKVDSKSLELTIVDIPREEARPRRLEITADGSVWYGDYAKGFLGRYKPNDGSFKEWKMPGGDQAAPYGMAQDDKGILWIAEGGSPNRMVSFNPETGEFLSVDDIVNARGAVRHMYFEPETRTVWFGEDTNYLGRVQVP